jgi:hypothetical protein
MTPSVGVVGRSLRSGAVVALIGCVGLLAWAGTAAAAETVTVGATLPMPAGPELNQAFLPIPGGFVTLASSAVLDAAVAPFSGTVTGWSIQGASKTPGYSISVFHPNPDGSFTVTAKSDAVEPTGAEPFESFTTDLPIEAGDYVGLDMPGSGSVTTTEGIASGSFAFLGEQAVGSVLPAITTGEKPTTTALVPVVMAYNAVIEAPAAPPSTGTGTGTEPSSTGTAGDGSGTPASGPAVGSSPPSPSTSPARELRCVVPRLDGKKPAAAKKALRAAHCKVGRVRRERGGRSKPPRVVKQSPKPRADLPAQSPVSIALD